MTANGEYIYMYVYVYICHPIYLNKSYLRRDRIERFGMQRCTLSKLSRSLDENVPEKFQGGSSSVQAAP